VVCQVTLVLLSTLFYFYSFARFYRPFLGYASSVRYTCCVTMWQLSAEQKSTVIWPPEEAAPLSPCQPVGL
jgi:hypothetical protein